MPATIFKRFHLSSYLTDDPNKLPELLAAAKSQTDFWLRKFNFTNTQINETKIFTGKVKRNRLEKELSGVFALIPLRDNDSFPAVWDAPLSNSLGEDITLEQQET